MWLLGVIGFSESGWTFQDHGASKALMSALPQWIHWFLWFTMILGHWSWFTILVTRVGTVHCRWLHRQPLLRPGLSKPACLPPLSQCLWKSWKKENNNNLDNSFRIATFQKLLASKNIIIIIHQRKWQWDRFSCFIPRIMILQQSH